MSGRVHLEIDGHVAVITNDNPDKHNAFDDEMDVQLFAAFEEVRNRPEVRAVIWRGEGQSFSSGRDVGAIGTNRTQLTHHQLMQRGHRGIQTVLALDVPVIVACKGWTIGGSFQRALLCDIRVAAEGSRFRLPEVTHGVIPDTGGVARLYQMAGHGLVSDMVFTGRVLTAEEALHHGVVSRVVPLDTLDEVVREMAGAIAAAPPLTVKLARRVIANLADPEVLASMEEELLAQTVIATSADFAEFKASKAEGREPRYVRG
ncbi:enoyl-CoA hydratase/isomerase family protein [Rhabdothermincola sediminis]|uniref:enoyl-CoA hydratase/isomerase family protein n=1 Tax=Rhabdothermincola sediminis TaxID=2751370 RepID=UPI001AA0AACA|nr:enoyl-CoA hydratase/isomerase family protein [Rhabdothermincola sediminis]